MSYGERRSAKQALSLLLCGRITPWKGQHIAIEAVSGARKGIRLIIVGAPTTASDEEWLEREIRPLAECAENIELRGVADSQKDIYREGQFLLNASLTDEPFGRTVIEGMAAGMIPIVADRGGPSEVVRPGVDGFTYVQGDPLSLGAAIDEAVGSSTEVLNAMSAKGRHRVAAIFSAPRNARQISEGVLE
jgi:glycosyltransferase involved in cell wall biosynthesis